MDSTGSVTVNQACCKMVEITVDVYKQDLKAKGTTDRITPFFFQLRQSATIIMKGKLTIFQLLLHACLFEVVRWPRHLKGAVILGVQGAETEYVDCLEQPRL